MDNDFLCTHTCVCICDPAYVGIINAVALWAIFQPPFATHRAALTPAQRALMVGGLLSIGWYTALLTGLITLKNNLPPTQQTEALDVPGGKKD
ncbi:MAG: hypothetical protein ACRCWR_11000 [Saezia sp.]